jgi:transcriptional regulator with XRE-family HTH domain
MNIGERIKSMRKASGFNQSLIAQYLNVDQSLISKIESGEREANTDIIRKLADLFGCSVKTFLDENANPNGLNVSFRANGLSVEDLTSIAVINRIALNLEMMEHILGEN